MRVTCVFLVLALGVAFPASAFADDEVGAPKPFDELWQTKRDPKLVEEAFLALLPAAREQDDADHLAQLLSQIARTHSARGNFDQSHKLLDEAEKVLGDAQGVARVRVLLERGRAFNSAKNVGKATPIFKQAYELAAKMKAEFYLVDAAHMLGICEEPDKALAWNIKAIKLAEDAKSPHAKKWLATLYNNTGWSLFEAGDYTKALDYFTRSAAFRKARKHDDRIARWSMAKALRMLKRYDEALAIQRALEAEYEAKKEVDGFVFEEIGEILWATDKQDDAKPYFQRAYDELQKISWVKSDTKRMDTIRTRAGLPAPDEPDEPEDAEPEDADEE